MYKDLDSYFVYGLDKNSGECVATCRILKPGVSYPDAASFGRVCVAASQRRNKLGKFLLQKAL